MNEIILAVEQNLNPYIPKKLNHALLWIPDKGRGMGIHIQGGKGSGKSRVMGRLIAWEDFIRGTPMVIFDPNGPTIDNFLDKITRMPREIQERLWPRVMYVDMSGQFGQVTPFPLYYRVGTESLYEISQRFMDVLRKLDPYLQTASVEGWNPLWRTGTYTGMILAALDFQITEADRLLNNPNYWERRFRDMLTAFPEAEPAVAHIRELSKARDNVRTRRTESFLNKIAIFTLDPSMKAMFGSSSPGVDWNRVIQRRQTVLLDFRHEHDIERRQFKMMWAFNYFLDFIKRRGAGRHQPISLVIDELTSLFPDKALASEIFGRELDELINVIARNYRVWLTIAHQEPFQLAERLQKSLFTMGTQIMGSTSDWESALYLAKQFYRYDPYLVKKEELTGWGTRTVEYTIDEQDLLHSYTFTGLKRYQFWVRPALNEGMVGSHLYPVSIKNVDRGLYPNEELIKQARMLLMKHFGVPIDDVLREIEERVRQRKALPKRPVEVLSREVSVEEVAPLWTE